MIYHLHVIFSLVYIDDNFPTSHVATINTNYTNIPPLTKCYYYHTNYIFSDMSCLSSHEVITPHVIHDDLSPLSYSMWFIHNMFIDEHNDTLLSSYEDVYEFLCW